MRTPNRLVIRRLRDAPVCVPSYPEFAFSGPQEGGSAMALADHFRKRLTDEELVTEYLSLASEQASNRHWASLTVTVDELRQVMIRITKSEDKSY